MREDGSHKCLKAVLAFCTLFLAGCYGAEPKNSFEESTGPKILAEFTIARGERPIFLPVTFKGKEYLFVLDTGCSHTTFDTSFRHQLGDAKKIGKGLTAGGPVMSELFHAPEAFIGPLDMQDCGEVSCSDFKMVSLVSGEKISGVIGMNFLKRYVIQIDFDEGILSFLKSTEHRNANWGKELAINFHSMGIPQIKGKILSDVTADFFIDTGCNSTGDLAGKLFKEVISKRKAKTSEALAITTAGIIRQRLARIGDLSIGLFDYQDLIFSEGIFSCLGLSFLSRHIVTFDFPNSKIYLKKGKEFKKVDETDMSGLHLLRVSNKTIVHSVDEGSPAQEAGIRANDAILKIGNKDTTEYNIWELRRLLMSINNHKITMTIKRGDDVNKVSFLLNRKI